MNEFLQLTDSQTGEPVFIAPNEIKSIRTLPAENNYVRRTVINGAITVKEDVTLIALATGRGFIGKEDMEKLYNQQTNSSIILQQFSERLKNPVVLTNPQKYLGPNTEKLLEFWSKVEKMTEEQLRVIEDRHDVFINENYSEWDKAIDLAWEASKKVVGYDYTYHAGWAALDVTNSYAADWATLELIGGVENPVFLKMFDNL